ncbi:MAG: hypothetical protein AAB874_06435 [Patescibacteria group bacterium]
MVRNNTIVTPHNHINKIVKSKPEKLLNTIGIHHSKKSEYGLSMDREYQGPKTRPHIDKLQIFVIYLSKLASNSSAGIYMPRKTRKQKIQAENRMSKNDTTLYSLASVRLPLSSQIKTSSVIDHEIYLSRDIKKTILLGLSFISIEVLISIIFGWL